MGFRLLADLIVLLHLAFIIYVLFGGLLCLRWPRNSWIHLPAVIWGVLIEFAGYICPLTPLENRLRQLSGEEGYGTGFIEHYIIPLIYPVTLTREVMIATGLIVIAVNLLIYALVWRYRRRRS